MKGRSAREMVGRLCNLTKVLPRKRVTAISRRHRKGRVPKLAPQMSEPQQLRPTKAGMSVSTKLSR